MLPTLSFCFCFGTRPDCYPPDRSGGNIGSMMHFQKQDAPLSTYALYRIAIVIGSLLLVIFILRPFIPGLTALALIAMATQRPHAYLMKRIRNRTAAALLETLAVTLCIVIPVMFLVNSIATNLLETVASLKSSGLSDSLRSAVVTGNSLAERHGLQGIHLELSGIVRRVLDLSGSALVSLVRGSVGVLTQVVAMLFLLFFWYRDGQRFLQNAVDVLPFTKTEIRFLVRRIRQTVRGTVFGRFIVALIQGISAAIAFWILKIPGASLLGLLTAVFALFPTLGAFFVWFPVVIYLLMIHSWGRAVALLLIGGGFLSTVDNVLFPVIAGSQTRMSTPQMFLSLLGAVWLFGVSGLVLGPVIFTLAESLVVIVSRQSRVQRAAIHG